MIADARRTGVMQFALILIGFTSVIAQIVVMRELIVVFHGNEISFGLILASWLIWTAAGSGILGRIFARFQQPHCAMAGLQLALALVLPVTILVVRAIKIPLHVTPGEVLGPAPMFLATFCVVSLFCVISGSLFASGSRLYQQAMDSSCVRSTGSVYLLEAVGSGLGGWITSLLLLRYLSSCEIALLLSVLNIIAAVALTLPRLSVRVITSGVLLTCIALVMALLAGQALDAYSLRYLWRDVKVEDVRNSAYGNLAVIATENTRSIYENGRILFTAPDPAAAEEAVHYALLQHPSPRSLLLIGGGLNGSLVEATTHPTIEHIDYVELDPTMIELYGEHFTKEWSVLEGDRRISIHRTDGRFFLQHREGRYDVIICNLPDPQTAQLNRFYTTEFYRTVAEHLTADGIFSFTVSGAENYISEDLAAFLRCIYHTLHQVFPRIMNIPGETIHFFASSETGSLVSQPDTLIARLRARGIHTQYVSEYYIPFRMEPGRMQELRSLIQPDSTTPVNGDFTPTAYYFNIALWSTRFHAALRQLFRTMAGIEFGRVLAALAAVILVFVLSFALLRRGEAKPRRITAGVCAAAMGFTVIGSEVLLLLAFQAIYGYVYQHLAVIIAAFMAGMALGCRQSLRSLADAATAAKDMESINRLLIVQCIAVISPVIMVILFYALPAFSQPTGRFATSHLLFPAMALFAGGLGGYQFPVCSRLYFRGERSSRAGLGAVYAFDLAGACLGAILFSTVLIPLFGFMNTALVMALLNLAPAMMLVIIRSVMSRSA
ncbi:MAG: fused MFS/spermidine synthase [Candidatus Latescibacterota bacterium]